MQITNSTTLTEILSQSTFDFTDCQLRQFELYYRLLLEWNAKINLTTLTTPAEVGIKHILDSLLALPNTASGRIIDVGTGLGMPGLAFKIYRPDLEITLLDSLQKRLRFLEVVIAELGLSGITLQHGRAEDLEPSERESYDLATARAVAGLNVLSEYLLPYVKVGGEMLALKGSQGLDEVNAAKSAIKVLGGGKIWTEEFELPLYKEKRVVVRVEKAKPTPKKYPRRNIKKNPL